MPLHIARPLLTWCDARGFIVINGTGVWQLIHSNRQIYHIGSYKFRLYKKILGRSVFLALKSIKKTTQTRSDNCRVRCRRLTCSNDDVNRNVERTLFERGGGYRQTINPKYPACHRRRRRNGGTWVVFQLPVPVLDKHLCFVERDEGHYIVTEIFQELEVCVASW